MVKPLESSNESVTAVATTAIDDEERSMAQEAFKAPGEFKCEECETEHDNLGELKDHGNRKHRVTSTPFPQVDGIRESFVETNQMRVLESQNNSQNSYARNCEHCSKFLRNNSDSAIFQFIHIQSGFIHLYCKSLL